MGYTKEARIHSYFPRVTEPECIRVETRSFLDRVFGGAVQPMLAHFVRESALSGDDIAELRRILDEGVARGAVTPSGPDKEKA